MRRRAANEATVAEQERHLYLAGLYQGREDAIMGAPCREAALVGSDTALSRGYAQGFNGWTKALCTERQREPRGVAMTARTDRPTPDREGSPLSEAYEVLRISVQDELMSSRLTPAEAAALLAERDALREQVKTLREGAQAACQFLIRTNLCPSDTLSALAELRAALAFTEAEVKP